MALPQTLPQDRDAMGEGCCHEGSQNEASALCQVSRTGISRTVRTEHDNPSPPLAERVHTHFPPMDLRAVCFVRLFSTCGPALGSLLSNAASRDALATAAANGSACVAAA